MSRVIVMNHVTLDGVMQAPGRSDEDPRDGFRLIASLIGADLIDEYLLMIHPLVLGTGRRLFPPGVTMSLRLTNATVTGSGVMIARYERAQNL